MTDSFAPAPVRDTPELRALLRSRCPQEDIVRVATSGWFELVQVENMRRRWMSFVVRGVRDPTRGQVYCYVLHFQPTTGQPTGSELLFLWDD